MVELSEVERQYERASHILDDEKKDEQTLQSSNDPQDPLNWSRSKKNVILLIVSAAAFIPDFASAMGAVTVLPQAQ